MLNVEAPSPAGLVFPESYTNFANQRGAFRTVATVYVIRFDDPQQSPMWLRSDYPAVKWGALANAKRYRTRAAAVSAANKLQMRKKLVIEEVPRVN